jgi:hypothetical protein
MLKMDSEKKRSTESATQSFLESVQEATEKQLNPTELFFYLTKEYDVSNHKILLAKLNSYRVRGIAYVWFESYISHWRQYTEINHKIITNLKQGKYISAMREIGHGMPQGSILGSLLFLLYIKYLPLNIMDSKAVLFADDTNISQQWKMKVPSV